MNTSRPCLYFAHANGFPGACYRGMLSALERDFEVHFLAASGHDPRYPVTEGWRHLVEELEAAVAATGRAPVIGVGHSLGGYLTFMAAARRPELFRAIVLLDSPILSRFRGNAFQFAKRIGLADRVTPAGSTRDRRSGWASVEAAAEHFRHKRLFRRFNPACLQDYVRCGTRADAAGVSLRFDPHVEYQIYRTMPHDMARFIPRLRVPAGFVYGRSSDVVQRAGLRTTARAMRLMPMEGGHLFPFEAPEQAARAVRRMIALLTGL